MSDSNGFLYFILLFNNNIITCNQQRQNAIHLQLYTPNINKLCLNCQTNSRLSLRASNVRHHKTRDK